jgi:hypothetical protein
MTFAADTKEAAYRRADGKCECDRIGHGHRGRCRAPLLAQSGWDARHITSPRIGGDDTFFNCEVVCVGCLAMLR